MEQTLTETKINRCPHCSRGRLTIIQRNARWN